MGKFERLQNAQWVDARPAIMHAETGFERSLLDHLFYMVVWRDEEPINFLRFEFTGLISGGYEIKIIDENDEKVTALEADEWIVVFQQYQL